MPKHTTFTLPGDHPNSFLIHLTASLVFKLLVQDTKMLNVKGERLFKKPWLRGLDKKTLRIFVPLMIQHFGLEVGIVAFLFRPDESRKHKVWWITKALGRVAQMSTLGEGPHFQLFDVRLTQAVGSRPLTLCSTMQCRVAAVCTALTVPRSFTA